MRKGSDGLPKAKKDFHINDEGFLDPCDDKYAKQFYRCSRGRIYPKTALGTWMHNTFKFAIRERQIELVWQLHRLHTTMQDLIKEQAMLKVGSKEWDSIENMLNKGARVYYEFDTELKNFRSK